MTTYRDHDGDLLTATQATLRALQKCRRAFPGSATEYDEGIAAVQARGADAISISTPNTMASPKKYWTPTEILDNEAVKPEMADHPELPIASLNTMLIYGNFKVS